VDRADRTDPVFQPLEKPPVANALRDCGRAWSRRRAKPQAGLARFHPEEVARVADALIQRYAPGAGRRPAVAADALALKQEETRLAPALEDARRSGVSTGVRWATLARRLAQVEVGVASALADAHRSKSRGRPAVSAAAWEWNLD